MKRILSLATAMTIFISLFAQAPKDKSDIEKLCGCFQVEFKYAETFSPDPAYKFHDRDEINGGIELILPVESTDKKIVIQHLLVISDSMIIKHWREDWTYENPDLFRYHGDKIWTKEQLQPAEVKGKWTQSVWEVSDAPRYQGASEWINTDGKTFWQNTSDAPLPRREYSIRNDYNVLRRTNRIILNDSGWVHEQDNQKIIRSKQGDRLLVEEKGINTYVKTNDLQCAGARAYWEKTKSYWASVRKTWETYLVSHSSVALKDVVESKPLHQWLNDLAEEFLRGKVAANEVDGRIKATLEKFIQPGSLATRSQ